MVEEFVPDRIKVSTKLDKSFLKPGESTSLDILALNFFGPPAANRNYECEIQVKQKYFSPAAFLINGVDQYFVATKNQINDRL